MACQIAARMTMLKKGAGMQWRHLVYFDLPSVTLTGTATDRPTHWHSLDSSWWRWQSLSLTQWQTVWVWALSQTHYSFCEVRMCECVCGCASAPVLWLTDSVWGCGKWVSVAVPVGGRHWLSWAWAEPARLSLSPETESDSEWETVTQICMCYPRPTIPSWLNICARALGNA